MVQRAKWKCFCNLSRKATNSCHRASTRGCSRSVAQSWSTEASAGTLSNTDHRPDHRIMVPIIGLGTTSLQLLLLWAARPPLLSIPSQLWPLRTAVHQKKPYWTAGITLHLLKHPSKHSSSGRVPRGPERPWTRISVATQWSRTMVLTRDLCSGVSCIGAAASSGTDCLPFKRLRFISAGHIAQWRPTKHRQTACMSRIRSNNKNDTRGSKDREVHPPRLLQQSADSTAAMIWNRWNRDTWISKNPTRNGAGTLSDLPPRGKHGDQEQPGTRGWENCTRIRGSWETSVGDRIIFSKNQISGTLPMR